MCRILIAALVGAASLSGFSQTASAQFGPPPKADPSQAVPSSKSPRLIIEETSHDFGRISDHEPVRCAFRFRNAGGSPLIITTIQSSCGCTVPTIAKTEYAPGESGEFTVEFNPANREGAQSKTVMISCNDPVTPAPTVTINAQVSPLVFSEPRSLNFGAIKKGSSATRRIALLGRGPTFDAHNIAAQSNPAAFEFRPVGTTDIVRGDEKFRQTEVDVTLKQMPVGRFGDTISFETGDPRMPRAQVIMTGVVQGDVSIVPPSLAFRRTVPGEPFEGAVRVKRTDGVSFRVLRASFPDDVPGSMRARIEVDSDEFIIRVEGVGDAKNGQFRTDLIIETDVPGEEKITVPVTGVNR